MTISPQVVARARDGDRTAFGSIYEAVAGDLYRVALYTLGNPDDAQDVVGETFMEAFKGIKNLRDENSFQSWIMRILSIRCKRRIGRYVREKGNIDIDDYIEEGVPDVSGLRVELVDALGRLAPQERQILILSALQGYTMREIADLLEIPQGTVSSKLHRTLAKLRKMLQP